MIEKVPTNGTEDSPERSVDPDLGRLINDGLGHAQDGNIDEALSCLEKIREMYQGKELSSAEIDLIEELEKQIENESNPEENNLDDE